MDENNGGLDRLCEIYEKLDNGDKERVIRLAEGLLNSQKTNGERKPIKFTDLDNNMGVNCG